MPRTHAWWLGVLACALAAAEPALAETIAQADTGGTGQREQALHTLGGVFPATPAVEDAVLRGLAAGEPAVRRAAMQAAGRLRCARAVPVLARSSAAGDAHADDAVQALAAIGEAAVPALVEQLAPGPRERRLRAVWALGQARNTAGQGALRAWLDGAGLDPDVQVRGLATWLLAGGRAKPPRKPVADLATLLADRNPAVRLRVAAALAEPVRLADGGSRPPTPAEAAERYADSLPAIAAALTAQDATAFALLAQVLEWLGPAAAPAVPALTACRDGADPAIRVRAGALLDVLAPGHAALLDQRLADLAGPRADPALMWFEQQGHLPDAALAPIAALLAPEGGADIHQRVRAVGLLGRRAAVTAPSLAGALADPAPAVRAAAVEALARMQPPGLASVAAVAGQLAGTAPARIAAAGTLMRWGQAAAPAAEALTTALAASRDEPAALDAVLLALSVIGPAAQRARPAVAALLEGPLGDTTLMHVVRALLAMVGPGHIGLSSELAMGRPDATRLRLAARLLVAHASGGGDHAGLAERLRDPATTRIALVCVAGLDPVPHAVVPGLLAVLVEPAFWRDGNDWTALNALRQIERSGARDRTVIDALTSALRHPDTLVRQDAARLLGSFGAAAASALPGLRAMLADERDHLRFAAAVGLAGLGSDAAPAIPELLALVRATRLDIAHQNACEAAVGALLAAGAPAGEVAAALRAAMAASGGACAWGMGAGLRQLGDDALPLIDDLVAAWPRSGHARPGIAQLLGRPAAAAASTAVLPLLVSGLADPEPEVRKACATALGTIGPAAAGALPQLAALAGDITCAGAVAEARARIAPPPAPVEEPRLPRPISPARPRPATPPPAPPRPTGADDF